MKKILLCCFDLYFNNFNYYFELGFFLDFMKFFISLGWVWNYDCFCFDDIDFWNLVVDVESELCKSN